MLGPLMKGVMKTVHGLYVLSHLSKSSIL